jgi:hypothetical protein
MFIVAIWSQSYAQKVDLDRFFIPVKYVSLPTKPIGFEYNTFSVQVTLSSLTSKLFTTDEIKGNFKIEGFNRVEENGDIAILLRISDISITRTEVKSRIDEEKNKEGKVVSSKTYYWLEIDYLMASEADVINNMTKLSLTKYSLDKSDNKFTFKSSEFGSYSAARDSYALNKEVVLKNLINGRVKHYYTLMNEELTNFYGFKKISNTEQVWISGSKKHPETKAYEENFNVMKEAFSLMTFEAPVDQIKEKIQPVIEYLNGLVKKYPADEKADKKMRYSAFYNLGKIYLFLDMPDEAIAQGNALIANDYDKIDGKWLVEQGNVLKELFKKNNLTSRHFERK